MAACFSIFRGLKRNCRMPPNTLKESCQACIISLSNWQTSISQSNQWKSDRQRITSWAAYVSIRIRKRHDRPVCLLQANAQPELTARTVSAETRSPDFRFLEKDPESLR